MNFRYRIKEFWNQRYRDDEFAYGIDPNEFLKEQLGLIQAGSILFPGEGEGRNAVYAAKSGWQVDASDWSDEAKNKAIKLAERFGVLIDYQVGDFEQIYLLLLMMLWHWCLYIFLPIKEGNSIDFSFGV